MDTGRFLATVAVVAVVGLGCGGAPETEVGGVVLEQEAEGSDRLELGPGAGEVGISLRFEDDGVELGSGQVLEQDPVTRHLVADVVREGDAVRCRAVLNAPADRPLHVRGELEVVLHLEDRAGSVVTHPEREPVDTEVAAGATTALPPGPAHAIDPAALRGVWCEAALEP